MEYIRFEFIEGSRLQIAWASHGKNGRTLRPVLVENHTDWPYEQPGYANRRVGEAVTVTFKIPDVPTRMHCTIYSNGDAYLAAEKFLRAIAREYYPNG